MLPERKAGLDSLDGSQVATTRLGEVLRDSSKRI